MSLYHEQLARERELADGVAKYLIVAAVVVLMVWLYRGGKEEFGPATWGVERVPAGEKKITVEVKDGMAMIEVRRYPKVLGSFGVAKATGGIAARIVGEPERTSAFVSRDPTWASREYLGANNWVEFAGTGPVWLVVECGKAEGVIR